MKSPQLPLHLSLRGPALTRAVEELGVDGPGRRRIEYFFICHIHNYSSDMCSLN